MSDSLRPHEPQHSRPPCPSPTPGVHPNPCPLCRWCHPTISSSVVPFSSCPQSFPASGSFQMNQIFWAPKKEMCMLVAQLCLTLYNPMDYSPSGSSVNEILQARILEWIAIPFSGGSSRPRDQTQFSCIAGRFFIIWATREARVKSEGLKEPIWAITFIWISRPCLLKPDLFGTNQPWFGWFNKNKDNLERKTLFQWFQYPPLWILKFCIYWGFAMSKMTPCCSVKLL